MAKPQRHGRVRYVAAKSGQARRDDNRRECCRQPPRTRGSKRLRSATMRVQMSRRGTRRRASWSHPTS